ncbi:MAG: hypothetical protein Q8P90_04925 [bacterium]|nr:hypothetical protein [bacterium]
MFKVIGILGLIFIIAGIVLKSRQSRNIVYIIGGICLTIYSIAINDIIFIVLQVVFTGVTIFDLIWSAKKNKIKS